MVFEDSCLTSTQFLFLKDRVVHLRLSRLVSGSERDLVACVLKRLLSGALSSGAPLEV